MQRSFVLLLTLFLGSAQGACSQRASASADRIERVSPAGEPFSLGKAITVNVGARERFVHRYRVEARRGQAVELTVESGGLALTVSMAPEGEEAGWKRGPSSRIVSAYTPAEDGPHALVVSGEGLTFNNTYQLLVRGKFRAAQAP